MHIVYVIVVLSISLKNLYALFHFKSLKLTESSPRKALCPLYFSYSQNYSM
jgi:hypothetical protein